MQKECTVDFRWKKDCFCTPGLTVNDQQRARIANDEMACLKVPEEGVHQKVEYNERCKDSVQKSHENKAATETVIRYEQSFTQARTGRRTPQSTASCSSASQNSFSPSHLDRKGTQASKTLNSTREPWSECSLAWLPAAIAPVAG